MSCSQAQPTEEGIVILGVPILAAAVALAAQDTPPAATEVRCRVISAVRADRVGAGPSTYRAANPAAASGVVVLVEFRFGTEVGDLRSAYLSLEYPAGKRARMARALGFRLAAAQTDDKPLDADPGWSFPHGNYKIPVRDPGPDGKDRVEPIRLVFELPNEVETGRLYYAGTPCGPPEKLPGRKATGS